MSMRKKSMGLALLALCVVLTACSSKKEKRREADPPVSRAAYCPADLTRFADAKKINDFGNARGCHVRNAWEVRSIAGVSLSQDSVFNCSTVHTTARWLHDVVQPAAEDWFGERVVEIEVPSAYACRTRNSRFGAKLSEHARGNAIDVSAFILESGERVSVLSDWNGSRKKRKFLRTVREEACGRFKTVLGPGADRFHKDHLHFDLQAHIVVNSMI
jgi:hypothetical protein